MNETSHPVIEAAGLARAYREGGSTLEVLNDVDLCLYEGESLAIVGTSGCGKSTLLNLLAGLDRPDKGTVAVDGRVLESLDEKSLGRLRNQKMGFVFQFHHLLPEFTALENVAMPLLIANAPVSQARQRATEVLNDVGLSQRLSHKPAQLSGGERQRVAIARALVMRPAVVMADEPTGNLDERTALQIQDLMLSLNEQYNTALLVVSHDAHFADRCGQCLELHNGHLRVRNCNT